MKTLRWFFLLILISVPAIRQLHGQETGTRRIVILPLHSNGIDPVYIQTSESILRVEIGKLSPMDIVSVKRTTEALRGAPCAESECAIDIGKQLDATEVLGCQLSALGEKIIVQYFLVNVSTGKDMLIDQVSAANAEDLEVLMKRLAKSVVNLEPIEKNAEVGKILSSESQASPRRITRRNFGFSFGYLYPQSGYENDQRSFIADARFDYELQDYAVGMLVGIRKGFAMNVYGSYLFSRADFCPYLGGAIGFHWVSHGFPAKNQQDFRSDGFELSAHAGLRVLHTYNFQIVFNVEYLVTLNDYNDRAIVFTIGIL